MRTSASAAHRNQFGSRPRSYRAAAFISCSHSLGEPYAIPYGWEAEALSKTTLPPDHHEDIGACEFLGHY